jgi:hypothetical protein
MDGRGNNVWQYQGHFLFFFQIQKALVKLTTVFGRPK